MEVVIVVVVVLVCAVVLLATPFRSESVGTEVATRAAERAELERAKEAKYREIREAELDYRTGKLSEEDWRATDATLRAQAMELLRRLDRLGE